MNLDYLNNKDIKLLYIDLFCGAGGTSTGVENAKHKGRKCAKVIGCVNHDKNAIASHAENHPNALHFTEDIRTLELSPLIAHIKKMRELYPDAFIVLWASLECTNFSKAKGGQPRDADSRTLAEHLYRYIKSIDPDFIQIENVEEFMSWGDLDDNGKPISKDSGRCYRQWVSNVCKYGYQFEHRILNSANYGAYTSRSRFFGIFAKQKLPIVFPEPTHTKNGDTGIFGTLASWKPVREVLDFSDEGESIFGRKKPLVDATLERIYSGLVKFVAGGKDKYLIQYNQRPNRIKSIDEPCNTVTTCNRFGLAKVNFIQQRNTGKPESKIISIERPARTITATGGNQELVSTHFLSKYYGGSPDGKNISVDAPAGAVTTHDHHSFISAYYGNGHNHKLSEPAPVVTCKDRLSLISPFFMNYYTGGGQHSGTDKPCPAVMPVPKQRLVSCKFIDQQFGNSKPASPEQPLGCITANPKYNLVSLRPWLMNTNFNNTGSDIDSPAPVVTANRKWHYLMNPQFTSPGGSIDKPCFTLIARMDKMPPYLIMTESGEIAIVPEETDTPSMLKIKEFMALYGIIDIKMRMLRIPELKQIMGFPKDYVLVGSQADQKKFIGNAVEVRTAKALCEALCNILFENEIYNIDNQKYKKIN
ncbi:MAG: DNA cytosine methyltransferase [Candidatus Symbiothrix sp.]|jgi:DNA (cytosine-5)-methyltransferase 1|nr:DNA cytosine methyltransferase [Candidatus Symbiothrix sp.]